MRSTDNSDNTDFAYENLARCQFWQCVYMAGIAPFLSTDAAKHVMTDGFVMQSTSTIATEPRLVQLRKL